MNSIDQPIGGYFELELRQGHEFHPAALRLNSARNALQYIIEQQKIATIYIPYYTCSVVLAAVLKTNCRHIFYSLGRDFMPEIDFSHQELDSWFLYTNYFGICNQQISAVFSANKNLIIDNSQAFFSLPLDTVPTIYSPRKFFGVPDGAYLYPGLVQVKNHAQLLKATSYSRCTHLLKRTDLSSVEGYGDFKESEFKLSEDPVKQMSLLTQRILQGIDYEYVSKRRRENFATLQLALGSINELDVSGYESNGAVPMCYPFLINNSKIRARLIQNKLFIPTFWENVRQWADTGSWERYLAENLLPLPIDQRYNETHMKVIIRKVLTALDIDPNVVRE